jgi:hypothetical protein
MQRRWIIYVVIPVKLLLYLRMLHEKRYGTVTHYLWAERCLGRVWSYEVQVQIALRVSASVFPFLLMVEARTMQ